ncbi:hypothetical protein P885DRAFT_59095 [Corynascus similis CBS 632.67]
MAFSSASFTSELASANGQLPQESQVIKQEPAAEESGHSLPSMPHSDKSQPPPSTDGNNDHEIGDDSVMGNTTSTASKGPASKKKKGTAAAVKGPTKRGRPGSAKRTKSGGPKKAKRDAAARQSGEADAADGGNSSESDNGPYCLCRGPDDHRFMIACDRCEDWFHGECIGMDKHTGENLVQKYICPNCTEGGRYTTRYKKMCSLAGCANPARIYDSVRPSIFCSPEHCQTWWEQLIATLPRTKSASAAADDQLTQEEFMGLLDASRPSPLQDDRDKGTDLPSRPWQLGTPPFSTPSNFWELPASSQALTPEEKTLLTTSATARYQLGEEIVLCKKMLQLIDLALKQREAAIAAGKGTAKDLCGYDSRLDTVGATHQFALFLQTPEGEAALSKFGTANGTTTTNGTNGLDTSSSTTSPTTASVPTLSSSTMPGSDPDFPYMCPKKKCKPHNGWSAILTKAVKHDMKELAAQAKEMLGAEQRVRDGAAGRFRRRIKEGNKVVVLSDDARMGVAAREGRESESGMMRMED